MRLILSPRKRTSVPIALFAIVALLLPLAVSADGFTRAILELSHAELENQYQLIVEYPSSVSNAKAIRWPGDCGLVNASKHQRGNDTIESFQISCDSPLTTGDTILIPYPVDAAVFSIQLDAWQSKTVFGYSPNGLELTLQQVEPRRRPLVEISQNYLFQGIQHIGLGWDHLAFVFCLCLMVSGLRQLIWTISAFTLGHSVSMSLSFLKLVTIPVPPIEAIIAASITLVAREAWLSSHDIDHVKLPLAKTLTMVVLFGLIHGLGFASALTNIGVAESERVSALIFFNLGVEVGQVMFIVVVITLLWLLRRLKKIDIFTKTALLFVGSVASFWTLERVASFHW